MNILHSPRCLVLLLILLVASTALNLWQFFRLEAATTENASRAPAAPAAPAKIHSQRSASDRQLAGPHGKAAEAEDILEPIGAVLPPNQQTEDFLIFGANTMTGRDTVYGEPHDRVSQQRLREMAKMPVSHADRFKIQARLQLPGNRMLDLGTVEVAPGQRVTLDRIQESLFPTSVLFAQASEMPQLFQPGSPITPTTPGEFDSRNRGLQIDIDVTPAPGALVLGGSVKHTVFEGYGWMPGEAFLPVVDNENTLLNDNKVLQPQFTTRESPFLAAATAGQACQIPVNTSFGHTALELTCTPLE